MNLTIYYLTLKFGQIYHGSPRIYKVQNILISIYNLEMSALMSDIKNPFLRDYSTTSVLKKNYDYFLVQSQLKQNNDNSYNQQKNQSKLYHQNLPPVSSLSNPYSHSTINPYQLLHPIKQSQNPKNSDVRSLSQSRSVFGSLDKNVMYKGLQDLATKQMMKIQKEKQARYLLKHYGPESLRYNYAPMDYTRSSEQKKNSYSLNGRAKSIKNTDSRVKIKSQRWKNHCDNNSYVTSEYYGYDGQKQMGDDDQLQLQKIKKYSFKEFSTKPISGHEVSSRQVSGRQPSGKQISHRQCSGKQLSERGKSERYSYYENISHIPEDYDEDYESGNQIKNNPLVEQDFYRSIEIQTPFKRRISIQNINPSNSHHQNSVLSAFGCSSEMYQSGANFITRFGGKNKGGPIDINAFDSDYKHEQDEYRIQHSMRMTRKKSFQKYPDTLEHNNKIYFKISLC